jgi:hypothetical protein
VQALKKLATGYPSPPRARAVSAIVRRNVDSLPGTRDILDFVVPMNDLGEFFAYVWNNKFTVGFAVSTSGAMDIQVLDPRTLSPPREAGRGGGRGGAATISSSQSARYRIGTRASPSAAPVAS